MKQSQVGGGRIIDDRVVTARGHGLNGSEIARAVEDKRNRRGVIIDHRAGAGRGRAAAAGDRDIQRPGIGRRFGPGETHVMRIAERIEQFDGRWRRGEAIRRARRQVGVVGRRSAGDGVV